MTSSELMARIVLRMSASTVAKDIRALAREELGVTDDSQIEAVAWGLYEKGWLETVRIVPDSIVAKLAPRGRSIAQNIGSIVALTRRFEGGGSLVVDPRQSDGP